MLGLSAAVLRAGGARLSSVSARASSLGNGASLSCLSVSSSSTSSCSSPVSSIGVLSQCSFSSSAVPDVEDRGFLDRLLLTLAKRYRASCGYHKYGLNRDDLINENKDIEEALSRLPKEELKAREFRFKRAFDASGHNDYLPKELWSDPEEKSYLDEHIEEIIRDRQERAEHA